MYFNFSIPTKIIFERNKLHHCQIKIESILPINSKILLCIGKNSVKHNGYLDTLINQLQNYEVTLLEGIQPNPLLMKAEEGLNRVKEKSITGIIALGGGSVMDTAKAIATCGSNNLSIQELFDGKQKPLQKGLPLVMIPTTPATSSELNQYSVLTSANGTKKGFGYKPQMCPDLAIIDPQLNTTLPKSEVKACLCDILAHSLEASWSKNANELTRFYSHKAIKMVLKHGHELYQNSENNDLHEKISFASVLAGFAFSHTGTTVSHAVSYPLTSLHNITHGIACGITLPLFYDYFGSKVDFSELNKALGVQNSAEGRKILEDFLDKICVSQKLSEYRIQMESVSQISEMAFPYKNDVNPVKISKQEMNNLLYKIK